MSQSGDFGDNGLDDGFTRYSEVAERIARKTAPGSSNKYFVDGANNLSDAVEDVISDLNNWVEFIDVRLFRGNVVGIPCRYRWTIKRWTSNDMDEWLLDNGWDRLAHLKADSRDHRDNEMEARYYKRFGDWDVFVNIYVEFTEDVFEELNEGSITRAKAEDGTDDHLDAMRRMKRSE